MVIGVLSSISMMVFSMHIRKNMLPLLLFLLISTELAILCHGGITSSYIRKPQKSVDMPLDSFPPPAGLNQPQQVHITQGDHEGKGVTVSWVTPTSRQPNFMSYWVEKEGREYSHVKQATTGSYKFHTYKSGYIHHATIKHLKYETKYIYQIGNRTFSFTTPPELGPDVPYTFGIIGDLGQTYDSNQTLNHYVSNPKGQAMLFAGDLSYADDFPNHDNRKWDTFGRFIEQSAAYQPWIWSAGNHEIDFAPSIGEKEPWKPYMYRYHVPYKESDSTSSLWYSIKRASTHIIVLSSYSAYGKYTPQYEWLQHEFSKVNRNQTPWLIVMLHSPWYNSNNYHYMEGESMRVMFEPWFVMNKVDLVLAGHVHSYERNYRVSNIKYNITNGLSTPVKDPSAPVYITIGDGGNIEGLANNFTEPQPSYSAFREASFGHGLLEIKNRTHAYFSWHRNQDSEAVVADSLWLHNRHFYPVDESP